jgi:hypothetical protein
MMISLIKSLLSNDRNGADWLCPNINYYTCSYGHSFEGEGISQDCLKETQKEFTKIIPLKLQP